MRPLDYLINDVRESTDHKSQNSIGQLEIIRYFNNGIKEIQALVFKQDPRCSFFQEYFQLDGNISGKSFDLPSNVYAQNMVNFVECKTTGEYYYPMDKIWPEDAVSFFGWYVRNKKIYFSGKESQLLFRQTRIWFFARHTQVASKFAEINAETTPNNYSLKNIQFLGAESSSPDITVYRAGVEIYSGPCTVVVNDLPIKTGTISLSGVVPTLTTGDILYSGKGVTPELNLPEEVEPYLLDYVARRIFGRQAYATDVARIESFSNEERANIISIFSDASKTVERPPILDTDYLEV